MEILSYGLMAFSGVILGMLGAGGSILLVPVLVYVLGMPATVATGHSLFIVGVSAIVSTCRKAKQGNVDFQLGLLFALPSLVGIYLTRRFLLPAVPDPVFSIGTIHAGKDNLLLLLFASAMLVTAKQMIFSNRSQIKEASPSSGLRAVIWGFGIGVFSGFIGAGGGFLIVPALIVGQGLSVHRAMGTSLFVIAVNLSIGFAGEIQVATHLDWSLLLLGTVLMSLGTFVGNIISKIIDQKSLKKAFGYFVLTMGIFIVLSSLGFIPKYTGPA